MSYWANYSGTIKCKDSILPEIIDLFSEYFENAYYDNKDNEFDIDGYTRYYGEDVSKALEIINPYCISGDINFHGDDGEHWRFIYKDGEWRKEEGLIFYESDLPQPAGNKEEFLGCIIDVIQDCLDNPEGKRIEGQWHDKVSDELSAIMEHWKVFI